MKWLVCTCMILLWLPGVAVAAQRPGWEFGLRGGMDATGVEESYSAGELYLLRDLPWKVEHGQQALMARIDIGAGILEAAGDHGGWFAAGADLVWLLGCGAIEIEAGFRPTWLAEHIYGNDDFGGDLQFASHGGIAVNLAQLMVSYRYQHISNASIYKKNGGLDLHLFGVGFRF